MTGLSAGLLLWGPQLCAAELTFDLSDYAYREETENGKFFMRDESKPAFVSLGFRDWDRPTSVGSLGFTYTAEGSAGRVSYHSRSSGTAKKKYYKGRGEVHLTYRANDMLTPFVGLGYRFLHDDIGGHPTSNGGIGYDRQNHLIYAPLGLWIDPVEKFSFKVQFNTLLIGFQKSYNSNTFASYPNAINKQDQGWGLDFAANYQINDKWATYGFYRYWDIHRSNNDCGVVPLNGYVCWWEPDNTTREIGVGIAYRF